MNEALLLITVFFAGAVIGGWAAYTSPLHDNHPVGLDVPTKAERYGKVRPKRPAPSKPFLDDVLPAVESGAPMPNVKPPKKPFPDCVMPHGGPAPPKSRDIGLFS